MDEHGSIELLQGAIDLHVHAAPSIFPRYADDIAVPSGTPIPDAMAAALSAADRRVRIPLAPGVDSLNVATAAAVAFHRLGPYA